MNLGSLLGLLGAQNAGNIPLTSSLPEAVGTDDIVSTGRKQQRLEYQPPAYDINPDSVSGPIEVNQARPDMSPFPRTAASPQEQARQNPLEGLLPHKGMFGIKGTLRDILGGLGDALLIGNGGDAMYQPRRQQERQSDALVGYGQGDTEQDNAAIARLMEVDPEAGLKLVDQQRTDQLRRYQYDTQAQSKIGAQRIQKAKMLPGLLAAAGDNPEQQQALKAWYADPQSSVEDLDPETLRNAAMTEYQKGQLDLGGKKIEQGDRRIGETTRHNKVTESIGQQNAQSSRIRANKSGSSSRPRADTPLEYFRSIDAIPEEKRTPGQKAFYKKYTATGKKGGVLDGLRGGNAPLTKTFKAGQTVYKGGKAYRVNADGKTATPIN